MTNKTTIIKILLDKLKREGGMKPGSVVIVGSNSFRVSEDEEARKRREEWERNRGKDYVYPSSVRVPMTIKGSK